MLYCIFSITFEFNIIKKKKMKTTIEIYFEDNFTWKKWKKKKKLNSCDLMRCIMNAVDMKKVQTFYDSLTRKDKSKKQLSNCKIKR